MKKKPAVQSLPLLPDSLAQYPLLYTVYEPEAICDYAACRDMQWLQYP